MTKAKIAEELIKQKAENVYVRCFDDDFIYPGVLLALEICAEEVATEATKELETQIEKMKCCYNCSKWNDGECKDCPSPIYTMADFNCEKWELTE